MKKAAQLLTVFLSSVVSAAFFIPLAAQAQIILPVSQGVQDVSDNQFYSDHSTWSIQIPHQSFTGTTTGAFLVFDTGGVAYDRNYQSATAQLTCGATTASYTTDTATYWGNVIPSSQPSLLDNGSPVFFDVSDQTCTVSIDYTLIAGHPNKFDYYGEASSTHPNWIVSGSGVASNVGVPYFSFATNGFQITPSASSLGIFFSGAVAFCNSAFASSTGIGAYIGNGLCVALGYLFVPTPESILQFGVIGDAAKTRLPFSYFYGIADIFQGLSASSTQNFPVYSFGLSQIDFASSTAMGPILPSNLEFLSSTTINKYMPVGMHDLLYNLMVLVIWVDVAFVLYHKIVPTKAKV